MRSWKTQVINLANVRGALFNPIGSLTNSKCPADDENAVMCLELGCRGIWKYPLAKSIELKILVFLLIFLSTSSSAGTGKHSSTVNWFRDLKSTTGLKDPSALGTSNRGLDHSEELGVMMPAVSIPLISSSKAFLLEWGILYAGNLIGLTPSLSLISCCKMDVFPMGRDLEGKTPGNAVNSFSIALFP